MKNTSTNNGLLFLFLLLINFEIVCSGNNKDTSSLPYIPQPVSVNNISTQEVFTHLLNILQLSELTTPFENSRARTRDYIVQSLTSGSNAFNGDQVFLHRFDWTDTTDNKGETLKTTWSGINILIWTNNTVLDHNQKYSIVAARYDSQLWWALEHHGNTFPCSITGSGGATKGPKSIEYCSRSLQIPNLTNRVRSIATAQELLGACITIQLARSVIKYQADLKRILDSLSPLEALYYWDKKDPQSIETGIYEETPVLFVLFDHESVGNLGSQVWAEYYGLGRQIKEGKIRSLTSIDLTGKYKPYENHSTRKTSNQISWQSISPNFSTTNDFLTTLLTQHDEDIINSSSSKKKEG